MNSNREKVITLKEAISTFVFDGSHISIGGSTVNRNPMAAIYEIIRQGIKNLHCYAHSNGICIDELIGGGCLSKLEIASDGNGKSASSCIRFNSALQRNEILFEDYSNYQMSLRFQAGAMGVPFIVLRSGKETDNLNKWGFSKKIRSKDPKIPDKKLEIIDNPFNGWAGTSEVILLPAIHPDVTVIHVQKSDKFGTCRIEGLSFTDIDMAKASKKVIITCEEIVDTEVLTNNPEHKQISFKHVSAVIHVPYGAYPSACHNYYYHDSNYLSQLSEFAKDDTLYQKYLEKFVYGVKNHQGLLNLVGEEQLENISADKRAGNTIGQDNSKTGTLMVS